MNSNFRYISLQNNTYYGCVNTVFVFQNRVFPYEPFEDYVVPKSSENILIDIRYENKISFKDGEGCNKEHAISFKKNGEYNIPITSLFNSSNKENNIKFIIGTQNKLCIIS